MPKDYVPTTDTELQAWLTNFVAVLTTNVGAIGLAAGDLTPLTTAQTNFNGAVTAQVAAEAAFRQSVQLKKTRRVTLEQTLRPLVRRITNHPGMTDALRAQLNITVPDRSPSRRNVGTEVPGMQLELRPGQVIVHFGTTPGNELTNSKPSWAVGCNISRKLAADKSDSYQLIAFDIASPYVDTIKGAAADYTYKVAYRGVRDTDIGAFCPEQKVAAGG